MSATQSNTQTEAYRKFQQACDQAWNRVQDLQTSWCILLVQENPNHPSFKSTLASNQKMNWVLDLKPEDKPKEPTLNDEMKPSWFSNRGLWIYWNPSERHWRKIIESHDRQARQAQEIIHQPICLCHCRQYTRFAFEYDYNADLTRPKVLHTRAINKIKTYTACNCCERHKQKCPNPVLDSHNHGYIVRDLDNCLYRTERTYTKPKPADRVRKSVHKPRQSMTRSISKYRNKNSGKYMADEFEFDQLDDQLDEFDEFDEIDQLDEFDDY
jgi:hypothetical protein